MAWISVHEQVIGKKLRELAKKAGCSQNEALGALIRLWLWAINNASKDGNIPGADSKDIAEILTPGKDRKYKAEDIVDAMVATGWIDIDIENGLYIHDWDEWQEQWYKAMEARERDAARKREKRRLQRLERTSSDNAASGADTGEAQTKPEDVPLPIPKMSLPVTATEQQSAAPKPESYTKDFEEFWKIYPRHIGKAEAYKKYRARLNDGFRESELLEAAVNYADKVRREKTEEQYVKHGKTFLSENMPFMDYLNKNYTAPKPQRANGFHNYEQRDTDYDAIMMQSVMAWTGGNGNGESS